MEKPFLSADSSAIGGRWKKLDKAKLPENTEKILKIKGILKAKRSGNMPKNVAQPILKRRTFFSSSI